MKLLSYITSVGLVLSVTLTYKALKNEIDVLRNTATETSFYSMQYRSPASYPVECFADRFNEKIIRDEIEAMLPQNKTTYSYHHGNEKGDGFDLTGLNELEYNLLSDRQYLNKDKPESWIYYSDLQKSCTNYECLIKKLYPESSKWGGLIEYWFYLKTGYGLAAQDFYPDSGGSSSRITHVSFSGLSIRDYLWSDLELQAHWWNAQALPPSMLYMPKLKWIHRLPGDQVPADWRSSLTAALNTAWYDGDYILVSSSCTQVDKNNVFGSKSWFYECLTHEIAHSLDRTYKVKLSVPLSQSEDYKKLSGWVLNELVTENGSVQRSWSYDKNAQFVSGYATSSPGEDFADSVAYYRHKPEEANRKAPEKFNFLKSRVFANRSYLKDDLVNDYAQRIVDEVERSIDDWSKSCLDESYKAISGGGLAQTNLKIDLPVSDSVKGCFQAQIQKVSDWVKAKIKYEEQSGCDLIKEKDLVIQQKAYALISDRLPRYFAQSTVAVQLLSGIKTLRMALEVKASQWSEGFTSCVNQSDPQQCVSEQASKVFDQTVAYVKQSSPADFNSWVESALENEKMRYLRTYSYDELQKSAKKWAANYVQQNQSALQENFFEFWSKCLASSVTSSVSTPLYAPYTGSSFYMTPGLLTCVNEGWAKALEALPKHSDSKYYAWVIQTYLTPLIEQTTNAEVLKKTQEDQTRLDLVIATNEKKWRNELVDAHLTGDACKLEVMKRVRAVFSEQKIYFLAMEPVLYKMQTSTCASVQVALSEKYGSEAMWTIWKTLFLKKSAELYPRCSSKIYFMPKLKQRCLFKDWDAQVQATQDEWLKDLSVKVAIDSLGMSPDAPLKRLLNEAEALKQQIYIDSSSQK